MTPQASTAPSTFMGQFSLHFVAQSSLATGGAPSQGTAGTAAPPRGGPAAPTSSQSPLSGLLFPVLMIGMMYLLLIRPMNKQRKEQEELNKMLKKGDKVVMRNGMIGTLSGLDEREVTVEISEKVRVRFMRDAIERKYETATSTETTAAEKKS